MTSLALETLWFEKSGIKLHAVAAGPKDGPLVILLHGFPEFWKSWQKQIEPLARAGYRVIVPDQRGYNLSDKPGRVSDYRLDRLADDIIGILDQLGVQQAHVAGHDWGAVVAWWLLTFHSERFKAGVILNVPHPRVMQFKLLTSIRQLTKSWYMFFFQLPGLPEWLIARHDWSFAVRSLLGSSRRGTFSREDLEDYKRAWAQPGAISAMVNWYRAAFRFPFSERKASARLISPPVLILWGEEDLFLSKEMALESVKLCAHGKCEYFPGVSHWIQQEEPVRVAKAMIEHFGAVETTQASVSS